MHRLVKSILEHTARLPEGTPVGAKGLLHLGSRAAIDQALSRLARKKQLLRVERGLYVRPVETRFGPRPPSVEKTMMGVASATGTTIAPHGAMAANRLGLTTQVPVRAVYLTSGRSRQVTLGSQTVELRHAPMWQLILDGQAGDLVRALAWAGREKASETLQAIRRSVPSSDLKELLDKRGQLPTWMAAQVSSLEQNV